MVQFLKECSRTTRHSAARGPAGSLLCASVGVALLLVAVPIPARAYGDPTGGAIFQILGPILALAWGAWMIFANGVRRRVGNLFRKVRGSKVPDPET